MKQNGIIVLIAVVIIAIVGYGVHKKMNKTQDPITLPSFPMSPTGQPTLPGAKAGCGCSAKRSI